MNFGAVAAIFFSFQDVQSSSPAPIPAAINSSDNIWLWIALSVGVLALIAAFILARIVLAGDTGTPEMRVISDAIREGAEAFLTRQYRTIGIMAVILAVIIFIGYRLSPNTHDLATRTVISFLVGAICSGLAGFTGMYVSIRANIRTASAARSSLNKALQSALRGGAVTGLVVVALALIGIGVLFLFFGGLNDPRHVVYELVGFGFGASLVALFAQLGGGIYTKAADVGADLVGKVEAGIPEDDPRNPAVIADLVGDNVGDCAGRGADIFESTAAENVGAMILGAALYPVFGIKGILFPLMVHAINLIASIIGVAVVKTNDTEDPMRALNRGFYVTSALALAGFAGIVYEMLNGPGVQPIYLFLCGVIGLVTAFLFVWITQYYTESRYRPVQSIAEASLTGPATNIISGLAVGMETPAMPVIVICSALLLSYYFGVKGLSGVHLPGISNYVKGIYGTAIATMGMLSCAAYILAMDTFGPITDNAGGIIEMSNQPDSVRDKTDKLDSAGNTTKALTKGYAVGSASLAAFLLFSAYLEEIKALVTAKVAAAGPAGFMPAGWSFTNINLAEIPVFAGATAGRHAGLSLLFHGHQSGGKNSADDRQGRSRPVPREPRHHGRHLQTRLRPLRLHRHRRSPQGDGPPRHPRRWSPHRSRPHLPQLQLRLRSRNRSPHPQRLLHRSHHQRHPGQPRRSHRCRRSADGRHHLRSAPRHADEQRRRRLGQRQEVDRSRQPRRQEVRRPQGRRSRRHCRRPLQGHGGSVAPRPHQTPRDDHPRPGPPLPLTQPHNNKAADFPKSAAFAIANQHLCHLDRSITPLSL